MKNTQSRIGPYLIATMSSEISLDVLDDAFPYVNERPPLDTGFILSLLFIAMASALVSPRQDFDSLIC